MCVLGVLSKPSFTLLLPGVACAALLAADPRTRSAWLRVAATLTPATLAHLAWMHHLGPAVGSRLGSTVRALPLGTYLRTHLFVSERWLNLFGTQLWLAWGWVDVVLRPGWYWLLWLFFAAALVGLALGLRTFARRDRLLVLAISLALGAQVAALLAVEWLLLRGGEG
ncbi:MAG: DUF2142 domain-containing protein [Deltaproteobacteria bacterium]|nr:DUF2142 domain-containing protein [Deltaproteobacteria bacterium]